MTHDNEEPSAASAGSAITARELFESLTHRQRVMLLEAIGTVPRWVVCGNAIQRTSAAPVVFFRAYRSHRRNGMRVGEAAYWAWRWTQAFCL
jgi:hypothetical protein